MNEAKPLMSVIIPVRNKVNTLRRSVESVYAQTYKNFELIIVDDDSTDGSSRLIEELSREYEFRYFKRSAPGPGGYAARNLGVDKARGEWVLFLDADDYIYPIHLSVMSDQINTHPNVELCVSAHERIENGQCDEVVCDEANGLLHGPAALTLMNGKDFIHMNGVCIKRIFFIRNGGFPVNVRKRSMDVYFWLRILINANLVSYRKCITSSWIRDDSDIAVDASNMQIHPLCFFLSCEEYDHLDKSQIRILKKIINRKILHWSAVKYQAHKSVKRDLFYLHYGVVSMSSIILILRLLSPWNTFGIRRKITKRWFLCK